MAAVSIVPTNAFFGEVRMPLRKFRLQGKSIEYLTIELDIDIPENATPEEIEQIVHDEGLDNLGMWEDDDPDAGDFEIIEFEEIEVGEDE